MVVVNDNSPESLELGQYYQDARGIPERNIFHISSTTNFTVDAASFSNDIRNPVLAYVSSSGLSNQVDFIVFSRGIPYRVAEGNASNGVTAAMFYGFKSSPPPCSLPSNTRSDYFEAERAFSHSGDLSSNRYYVSTVLQGWTLDATRRALDRSVSADGTRPTGTVFFVHTTDTARNVQWPQYENADFTARFLDIPQERVLVDAEFVAGETNIVGYMIGRQGVASLDQNHFAPGALGDHLTSQGGHLLDEISGQMSALHWLLHGTAGSYGTVLEPCNFTNKFPQARLHFWYGRGFSLAESYFMSVRNPYEGVVVGDALCAPYAVRPAAAIGGLAAGQVVTGAVSLVVTGLAAAASAQVHRIDVYVDGFLQMSLTNVSPRAGNQVLLSLNGSNYAHVVTSGQSIHAVAASLASLANANTGVSARAYGDRIELVQRALGVPGAGISYSVTSTVHLASELTVHAAGAGTNFLETYAYAHEQVALGGTPASGDVVRAVVTRLDGGVFTNEVQAGTSDTALTLMQALAAAVNTNAALVDANGCEVRWIGFNFNLAAYEGFFVARTNTWEGHNLFLVFSLSNAPGSTLTGPGFSDNFNDNRGVLPARGAVFLSEGFQALDASWTLETTNLADGPHTLTAVVFDGSAVKAQGRVSVPFIVDNNSLTCTVVEPVSGHHELRGTAITVTAAVAGGTITQVSLFAEGKLYAQTSAPPYAWTWATTNVGAGLIELQARADGTANQSVLSDVAFVTLYSDDDGDGASDQWEYRHFGSATNWDGVADPDGDGVGNAEEFLADS
ncbi:MAG TPA: TIGR03790 family protein, partial [Kiritimatiellia bacterium]